MSDAQERYARINEILAGARDLEGAQLEGFLDDACGDDTSMRDEILELLEAGQDARTDALSEGRIGGVRDHLADVFSDAGITARLPEAIGPYRVIRQLGRGGMGIVYEAEQENPRRTVALKVLQPGLVREELLRRFAQEAQILGLLQHPNIASVYDAGTCELGFGEVPFFAMELVDGRPLTEFARERELDVQACIDLLARTCEAVHHAHERGIVHRDLKPANILVKESTGSGGPQPVVLDFGIARSTDVDRELTSHRTRTGQLLGTLAYMSPEQVGGEDLIDPRSDVYSLGVILYELLAGRLPLNPEEVGLAEVGRIIREVEPTPLGRLRSECRGDVETVCAKALAKERDYRYGSALEFADDLRRILADRPVSARPPSSMYRAVTFARRNRILVRSLAVTFVVLLAGVAVAVPLMFRAERSEAGARTNLSQFEAKVEEFQQLAAVVRLEEVTASEQELYPAWPHMEPALRAWLQDECASLFDMRGSIERTVNELADLGDQDDSSSRFLRDTLSVWLEQMATMEALQKKQVEQRLRWAEGVDEWTREHPNARVSWQTVREQIAARSDYDGVDLRAEDLLGLVPLGANPVTGLQEFYHLRSAWDGEGDPAALPIPEHRDDGSIELEGSTGIVFALLPRGPLLTADEYISPVPGVSPSRELQEVEIAPFLLARHELTQGQWTRLWSGDPSRAKPSQFFDGGKVVTWSFTARNPVESVTWWECDALLAQHGLTLPSSAQWEYGCRGGTTGPFSCPENELPLYANLADQSAKEAPGPASWRYEDWNDGHYIHAPVATFLPNAFGLHDVHGNVKEWAADVLDMLEPPKRRMCGAAYNNARSSARSAHRGQELPSVKLSDTGLRAARHLRGND